MCARGHGRIDGRGLVYVGLDSRRWGKWGRLAYSMGGASASWQMFPARPHHSSSVNLRDVKVVPSNALNISNNSSARRQLGIPVIRCKAVDSLLATTCRKLWKLSVKPKMSWCGIGPKRVIVQGRVRCSVHPNRVH